MRKSVILSVIAIAIALLVSSCKKDYFNEMSTKKQVVVDTVKNGNDKWTYVYSYQPTELVSAPSVTSLGTNTDGYPEVKVTFTVSLGNSKVDPRVGTINIPHVGPKASNGISPMVYSNVNNDAAYNIESTDKANGRITISIKTEIPSNPGYTDLKFNFNIDNGDGNLHWFQAYGNYAQCGYSTIDDNTNNIYGIRVYSNRVTSLYH